MEQRIVIKFFVGENVLASELRYRLQQQHGKEYLTESRVDASEKATRGKAFGLQTTKSLSRLFWTGYAANQKPF
ncbi:hypothetical protein AVEN_135391-1 [Araneus ventricosus]|uniref:Uncharacterized protein n=1 Tax=Araneus ventricosus TaxID=182803 RepID=A0A4Y2KX77_ARAVE|nr:hypothetical protein AVEN_135391-1 [Araneus ventricosus]